MEALEAAPITQKIIRYTPVFEANQASRASVVVNVGGAGSSKSYSIAQLLISKFLNEENKVFGVIRKTYPALRMTSLDLIMRLLKEYGIYKEERHNKTANTYSYKNNVMWFLSLDEESKIRSTNFSYLWVEEASEISWEEFITLKLRLRVPVKSGEQNVIYLSLNPSDSFSWVATRLCGVEAKDVV